MSDDRVIRPDQEDGFFIGWSPDVPLIDRRFLLSMAAGMTVAGAGAAAWLAFEQRGPGTASWNPGDVRDWIGGVFADPYPMMRYRDDAGAIRTALLFCETKCGVRQRLGALAEGPSRVTASELRRGRHRALAVIQGVDWIGRAEIERPDPALLAAPEPRFLGSATLRGEVLDSKCWFGAMRPGSGKPHKACASLCLRHGIAPSFLTRDPSGRERSVLLVDAAGGPIAPDEDFLALAADPAEATGELVALGDLVTFRVEPRDIARI